MAELRRRQHYQRGGPHRATSDKPPPLPAKQLQHHPSGKQRNTPPSSIRTRKCYTCGSTEHLARDCKSVKGESNVRSGQEGKTPNPKAKMVTSHSPNDPLQYMYSSDSEEVRF